MSTDTTRKTWRDLPPEPPFGDVPEAPPRPPPDEPPPPAVLALEGAPPKRRRRWAVLGVPLLLLALALVIGGAVWALFVDGDDAEVAGDGPPVEDVDERPSGLADDPVAPPDADVPFGPEADELLPPEFLDRFGRNFFDEFGPDLQIPDELMERFPEFFFEEFGRDFFGEGGPGFGFGFGEDFEQSLPPDLADQLRELRRFFDDFAGDNPGEEFGSLFDALPPDLRDELPADMPERFSDLFDRLVPGASPTIGGAAPTYLPDGFRVGAASMRTDGTGTFRIEIRLTGPGGPVDVEVLRGGGADAAFDAAPGEEITIAGESGREDVAGGTRTLTYRKDGATVRITAPEAFDRIELERLAAGLEVAR